MWRILIDTNVWIDLASNYKEHVLIDVLEDLVQAGTVRLIMPRLVLTEFATRKEATIKQGTQRTTTAITNAKLAIRSVHDTKENQELKKLLEDVGQKASLAGEATDIAVMRVERLMASTPAIEISDDLKLRAATRAIERQAPCHTDKNAINDAIIVETFADERGRKQPAMRYAFVSKNHKDFSVSSGNQKEPHPDIAALFDTGNRDMARSFYFIDLAEALEMVAPDELSEANYVATGMGEPRTLSEIGEALDLLTDQVWYNRHKVREEKVGAGSITLGQRKDMGDHSRIDPRIWTGAMAAARRVEERRGLENLGPWDDFEWGMINGKLSALRWVLGDEWDFLDT